MAPLPKEDVLQGGIDVKQCTCIFDKFPQEIKHCERTEWRAGSTTNVAYHLENKPELKSAG